MIGYAAERVSRFPVTDDHPGAESTYPDHIRPAQHLRELYHDVTADYE